MSTVVVAIGETRMTLPSDTPAICLTPETRELLARSFPDGICYFDRGRHPLAAGHEAMQHFQHDPREPVTVGGTAGPHFYDLGQVETLAAAIVGAEVLVQRRVGGRFGESWWPALVVADASAVLLNDGKLLAADCVAVSVSSRSDVPTDTFELAPDGAPWKKAKSGPPVRLPRFCGPAGRVGDLVASGSTRLMVRTAPPPMSKWQFVEVGT